MFGWLVAQTARIYFQSSQITLSLSVVVVGLFLEVPSWPLVNLFSFSCMSVTVNLCLPFKKILKDSIFIICLWV